VTPLRIDISALCSAGWLRSSDLRFNRPPLYQLSYCGAQRTKKMWWSLRESNSPPLRCHHSVLPNELKPRMCFAPQVGIEPTHKPLKKPTVVIRLAEATSFRRNGFCWATLYRLSYCGTKHTKKHGGADRHRTDNLLLAKQMLSQLSYGPMFGGSGEIRTHEPFSEPPVFEAGALDRSATLP
jgi:hypothetical protein